ncbi:MAG: DUF1538 domain-containing protein [Lachnospiraceae bacterium]|nr:DUF1538 domain-containing protein [Lachnospiraceae bacterium]
MFRNSKTILFSKVKESLASVLPIAAIVFLLCFTIVPVPTDLLMTFVLGVAMVIIGMGMFTLGADLSMTPVGEHIGSTVTKSRKLWFIVLMCFLVGAIVTISEPDLQVLAEQVPNIPNQVIVFSVAAGVGLFLVIAMLRIVFNWRLSHLLIFFYTAVFVLAEFVPKAFLAVAFDSGGVTTGPMTVPFIMALGVGVASIRSDSNAQNDSFGLVALCSVGPILAVMLLGLFFNVEGGAYTPVEIKEAETSRDLWKLFAGELPAYLWEVAKALLPIVAFFAFFQLFRLKLKKENIYRISVGFIYTFVGLVLFLCGANVGFMTVGNYIGRELGRLPYRFIVIPLGMLIGYYIVEAEPAVHVLNKQVYEMTSGSIPPKALSRSLSIGVAISVGLSMLRIVADIPILFFLIPGYLIAIVLSFFVPPIFTAIAFDSGGVASGPMTATFLLPMSIGVCNGIGGDVVSGAFGVVAMVAMTPLITIQILGLVFKIKSRKAENEIPKETVDNEIEIFDNEIFELEDGNGKL